MVDVPRTATNPSPRSSGATGQGLVEYVLILAIVAVLAIGTTTFLGRQLSGTFDGIAQGLNGVFPELLPSATSIPVPTGPPPAFYTKKKTCTAAGYKWVTKPKPAHCGP